MSKIDVEKITIRQKLIIEKGLCDYKYIMDNWKNNDDDFQMVFYEFYLKSRWAIMKKDENKTPYFQLLVEINPDEDITSVLEQLKGRMEAKTYEFSLGSKLLHTRNPMVPIYDSKVREYLKKEEGVILWWYGKGAPRKLYDIQKIKHDWNMIVEWYSSVLNSDRGQKWIEWFDANFSNGREISNIKKIDFIIFATQ